MRYKTKYSGGEEYTVYRYFHYTPRQLGLRGLLATFCAAITIFLLVPLPDEIFIVPAIAKAWQQVLPLEFRQAMLYGYATYKAIGLLFLALTALFGYQYLRDAFASKLKHIKKAGKAIEANLQATQKTLMPKQEKPKHYYVLVPRKR